MVHVLKPSEELIVAGTSVAVVAAIFSNTTPNVADVRADKPGNTNTYKSTKLAVISSAAAIGTIALVAKSPTVATIGGAMILFEAWKLHFANFGANGTEENQVQNAVG